MIAIFNLIIYDNRYASEVVSSYSFPPISMLHMGDLAVLRPATVSGGGRGGGGGGLSPGPWGRGAARPWAQCSKAA